MKKQEKKKSFLESHPEAKGLFLLGIAALMLLSLLSFHPMAPRENWLGLVGFSIAYGMTYVMGLGSFLLMFYLGFLGFKFLSRGSVLHIKAKHFYFGTFLVSCCILFNLIAEVKAPFPDILMQKVPVETIVLQLPYPQMHIRHNLGGVPLYYLYRDLPTVNLMHLLSNVGIGITFSIISLVSMLLFTETKAITLWMGLKRFCSWVVTSLKDIDLSKKPQPLKETPLNEEVVMPEPIFRPEPIKQPKPKKVRKLPAETKRTIAIRAQRVVNGDFAHFKIPPAQLLKSPKKVDLSTLKRDLRRQAERLEETLMSFGIEAKVGDIHCGPTITSFEVQPSVGVKVQKIKALENDIALNLQARSIRIIAPIPGKAAVGIEIPSIIQQEVSFKELLIAYQQKRQKAQIPILLGKTVSGELVLSDLAKMPHCIIAGATGSGKSVCINTIVLSIVMNARPDEVKLLMIDPKKVELTGYTNLPHMIAPVITEAHGAYAALSWLVKEMQKRYDILKQMGLRNIQSFNGRKRDLKYEETLNIEIPETMPKFVAIIDEFADLMMASSSDLETPIARIAQMARAVGIHLILATQRPSREVITGLIKANFPTRISFKVASRINSQIILDETGAENLLGNGDMLFLPPGTSNLVRAQGSYISDDEINQVIRYVCDQAPPNYLIPSFDTMPKEDLSILAGVEDESKDQLYDDALSTVVETGTASTTFLQRKLKIGYARAASLMDELERNGVIGPQEGAKPRRVLLNTPNED
ncbi:MAG: DNA translocase FtsK 4TM domain-containing protein [Simkaniaceae bacterium]|nr:DNA translocase FtsK 4TM domain-containing protein [Candidatus Sacchlamyda saccharinae]